MTPWPTVPLKRVASINDEALGEKTDPEERIVYIDIGNVSSEGEILDTAEYTFEKAPSRARRIVRDGDVIISTVRTYLQAIAPIINPPEATIASTGFAVVRPNQEVLFPGFCKYALRDLDFLAKVQRRSTGVSYPAITASALAKIRIPLPPEAEQRAIAADLDRETARLDALVDAKRQLVDRLAEKRRAVVAQAVTRGLDPDAPMQASGVPWLGEIPAHWEVERLRWLLDDLGQGWSPSANDRPPEAGAWGVLKLSAISGGRFLPRYSKSLPEELEPREDFEVRPGDVLLTRANTPSLVGEACYVQETPPHLMLSDLIYRLEIRKEKIDGQFLAFVLRSPLGRVQIEQDARGSSLSMVKISQTHIRDWVVPLPPLSEQKRIVESVRSRLAQLDQVVKATEGSISLLRERRAALISATVTGRRRVL